MSEELGGLLAEGDHLCVNGGGAFGCMGALNKGAHAKGGKVLGVIHDMFVVEEEDKTIQNMLVSKGDTLSERKQLLVDNSDCIIVLPGGVGTLDELWESTCNRSLRLGGMEKIPICVLNVDGYYDGSLAQLSRAFKDGLLYNQTEQYFHVESDSSAAIAWCLEEVARENAETDASMPSTKSNDRKSTRSKFAWDTTSFLGGVGVGVLTMSVLMRLRLINK